MSCGSLSGHKFQLYKLKTAGDRTDGNIKRRSKQ